MTTALWLVFYGAALAWLAPPVLRRLTRGGVSPSMGVAAWLATIAAALAAWLAAVVLVHELAEIVVIANGVRAGRTHSLPAAPAPAPAPAAPVAHT